VTIDEELSVLEDTVRRLKVEYDVFFGGGSKKPPDDTEWRVKSLIKKHQDGQRMKFTQRFRYNSIVQKYAIYSDLWRQKMKIKEEGYRRPADALLGVQGLRHEEEKAAADALKPSGPAVEFTVRCSGGENETDKVRALFEAMLTAKKRIGVPVGAANLDSFTFFIRLKTEQIRRDYGCHAVEYAVEVEQGQVKLKARAQR
jgi:hypothetical protein